MRRTSVTTLVEQARLFALLLTYAPDSTLAHHADDIRLFLAFLHDRAEITQSVSTLLPVGAFPPADSLIPGAGGSEERIVGSRKLLARVLGELTERRVKFALRQA